MTNTNLAHEEAYQRLRQAILDQLGERALIEDADALETFLTESRGLYRGDAPFVLLPANAEEVSKAVRLIAAEGLAVVPQGGNTGRVGGGVPYRELGAVPLNLKRMNKVRSLDPLNHTLTAEAGCILADLQSAASDADRLFPLSLGAEGSCMIGGNLASNAGGIHVLRYGNTRDLVLGLEVVLPDGRLWQGLRSLRKDNTGYDLKHLFLGSEGTLGVITAASFKLFPKPRESGSCFIALRDLEDALDLLASAKEALGGSLAACELIPRIALEFSIRHVDGIKDPLRTQAPWYLLMEVTAGQTDSGLAEKLESLLAQAYEAGRITDATIASSQDQEARLWRIREALVAAQTAEGASIKHDIAVPVSQVPRLIREATALATSMIPGIRPYPFGHLGDGNIHFNFAQPLDMEREAFMARRGDIQKAIHELTRKLGGTISAEHGVGRVKRDDLLKQKSSIELDLMRVIKTTLDPQGTMNPGVIFQPQEG